MHELPLLKAVSAPPRTTAILPALYAAKLADADRLEELSDFTPLLPGDRTITFSDLGGMDEQQNGNKIFSPKQKGLAKLANPLFLNGRSETIRTFDPLLPRQVRYQAALRSEKEKFYSTVSGVNASLLRYFSSRRADQTGSQENWRFRCSSGFWR